jgi:hypothetical protein
MISSAQFDCEISRLRERVFPLKRLLHGLALTLEAPELFKGRDERGFRFQKPELVHFCLLRGVRIVRALNASIELARSGFSQEVAVLLRTMIEYPTQIDFMLASLDPNGKLSADASAFVSGYFADDRRGGDQSSKKAKLIQKKVHAIIGARLDNAAGSESKKPAAQMLSNVYLIFSNYVHGRYPESMDLYGGTPGRFHLAGMRRTPKDDENIEILDTMIRSASLCFMGLVQALKLQAIVSPIRCWWIGSARFDGSQLRESERCGVQSQP